MFMNFLQNLWRFFISANANAYWTIVYWLSKNWFIISSLVFIGILLFFEIKIKTEHIIDDKRDIY